MLKPEEQALKDAERRIFAVIALIVLEKACQPLLFRLFLGEP